MVGSLIVASITNTAVAAFTLAQTAAAFAINFAVSQIVTRVFADNPERQQDMGVRQQVPPSAVNAIPIVYGNAYMGGTFVDAVLTTDQKTMYYVLAISSISPDGQFTFDTTDMYYGDRKITFDGTDLTKVVSLTDEAGNVDTKINDNLFINLYRSNAAGTITSLNGAAAPSTVMGGSDIAVGQRWTGTRQMNSLGFAIVKLVYNRDAGTTQLSPITFKVAHTLRGTGVAKPGDVWYDYITNPVYGGAVEATSVDDASRTTLNTYSDALITFTSSGGSPSTQARYRINGVLDAGESVLSNIDRIMSSCDSWMTYNAALGQWSVVVNKPETVQFAFNDNNIIGDIRVSATDITSSINQVEARFPFKENRDQANFINIETPSGLLYPNEPVNKYSITYDLVNDSVQAQYLANRLLEQAREDLIVSFNTTYFGIQVDAGDVVSLTNSDYGWNAKLFRVMKVNEASLGDGSLGARLELSEYNALVYDDQTINQFAPVANSGLPSVMYFSALSAPTVLASSPGSAIPNFNVSVAIPATGRVTYGELYYTTVAVPASSDWKLLSTAGTIDGEAVTPGSTYVFTNQVLPTGANPTATYYFSYLVGNDLAQSNRSPTSTAFFWEPFINGETIEEDTIKVDRLENNTSGTFNSFVTYGLGTGSSVGPFEAGGSFVSSSASFGGLITANTGGGDALLAGTTSTDGANTAIVGVGYSNSAFTTFRTLGALGSGEEGGSFQTGGAGNLQTATTADIRLARYTGGVSYALYIISGSTFPFTAGHDALQLLTENVPQIGDIMVDVQLIAADNINDNITKMSPSTAANQKGAIGVFVGVCGADFVPAALGHHVSSEDSLQSQFVFKPEYENIYDTYRPIAINAIGEGKINVCNQGGDISIGDLIVCSDVPGKGMKQADDVFRSYTVAKARENVTFTGPSDIRQIACIYMGG